MHGMAYLQKWEQFSNINNNIFPVIQDQIWYNGITHPPSVWKKQAGHPKMKWLGNEVNSLILENHQ